MSRFSDYVIKEGHEIKPVEEIMTTMKVEKNHGKINTLEEIEILKVASSRNLLNEVINGRNDVTYKPLPFVFVYLYLF